jgi:hypothetical protein
MFFPIAGDPIIEDYGRIYEQGQPSPTLVSYTAVV